MVILSLKFENHWYRLKGKYAGNRQRTRPDKGGKENDRMAEEKKDGVHINALFYFFMSVYK